MKAVSFQLRGTPNTATRKATKARDTHDTITVLAPAVRLWLVTTRRHARQHIHGDGLRPFFRPGKAGGSVRLTWTIIGRVHICYVTGRCFGGRVLGIVSHSGHEIPEERLLTIGTALTKLTITSIHRIFGVIGLFETFRDVDCLHRSILKTPGLLSLRTGDTAGERPRGPMILFHRTENHRIYDSLRMRHILSHASHTTDLNIALLYRPVLPDLRVIATPNRVQITTACGIAPERTATLATDIGFLSRRI